MMSQKNRHRITSALTESSSESVIVSWCRSDSIESNSSTSLHFARSRQSVFPFNHQSEHHPHHTHRKHKAYVSVSDENNPKCKPESTSFRRDIARTRNQQGQKSAKHYTSSKSVTFAPKMDVFQSPEKCQPTCPSYVMGKGHHKQSSSIGCRMPRKSVSESRGQNARGQRPGDRRAKNDDKLLKNGNHSSTKSTITIPKKTASMAVRDNRNSTGDYRETRKEQKQCLDKTTEGMSQGSLRRAKSTIPRERSRMQSRCMTRSAPVLQVPRGIDLSDETGIASHTKNGFNQTVAHSQMKYWHLRKIIREVLIRHGDIEENECSRDIDEAISTYAIHLMFKENGSQKKMRTFSQQIHEGIDKVMDYKENKGLNADDIEGYKLSIEKESTDPSSDIGDAKNSNPINRDVETPNYSKYSKLMNKQYSDESLQMGNKAKTTDLQMEADAGPLTSSQSFGGRLVNRLLSVFSSRTSDDIHKTSRSSNYALDKQFSESHSQLHDQLSQLVNKSSQLMADTQQNLTTLGSMIENIQSVLITKRLSDKAKDSTTNVDIPKIEIDHPINVTTIDDDNMKRDRYEYELHDDQMTTIIPISGATSNSSVLPSRPESPYPRIYPIINPGGDAVIIHNSNTMEDEEVVIPLVDTSLDAGRMWEEANQLMAITAPDIDVSLDPDAMWQEIMTNVGKYATSRNSQQETTTWWTCPSTPLNDETSLEEANWSFQLLPKSSTSSTSVSKVSDKESSSSFLSSSPERFLSKVQTDMKGCLSFTENDQVHSDGIGRQNESLTKNNVIPDDTRQKLNNVIGTMEKMLSELSNIMDTLPSTVIHNNPTLSLDLMHIKTSSEWGIQESRSNTESSLQSSAAASSEASNKPTRTTKPSKCDELVDKLNQSLQKIFTQNNRRCKPPDCAIPSFHQEPSTDVIGVIDKMSAETEETCPSSCFDTENCNSSVEDVYIG